MTISKWVLSFQYEEKGYVKFTLMTILNVFSLIPEMWYIDNQVKENKSYIKKFCAACITA